MRFESLMLSDRTLDKYQANGLKMLEPGASMFLTSVYPNAGRHGEKWLRLRQQCRLRSLRSSNILRVNRALVQQSVDGICLEYFLMRILKDGSFQAHQTHQPTDPLSRSTRWQLAAGNPTFLKRSSWIAAGMDGSDRSMYPIGVSETRGCRTRLSSRTCATNIKMQLLTIGACHLS